MTSNDRSIASGLVDYFYRKVHGQHARETLFGPNWRVQKCFTLLFVWLQTELIPSWKVEPLITMKTFLGFLANVPKAGMETRFPLVIFSALLGMKNELPNTTCTSHEKNNQLRQSIKKQQAGLKIWSSSRWLLTSVMGLQHLTTKRWNPPGRKHWKDPTLSPQFVSICTTCYAH